MKLSELDGQLEKKVSYLFYFYDGYQDDQSVITRIKDIEDFGRAIGGKSKLSGIRRFEYPFVEALIRNNFSKNDLILDIGTKNNPLPWLLNDFNWIASDTRTIYFSRWRDWCKKSSNKVAQKLINAKNITLRNASIDGYVSISVIEHIPARRVVFEEIARVVKTNGLAIITFDWLDSEKGMEWIRNDGGAGLTNAELTELNDSRYFYPIQQLNSPDDPDVLSYYYWHKSLGYNYSAGCIILRRNEIPYNKVNTTRRGGQRIFEFLTGYALYAEFIGRFKGYAIKLFPVLNRFRNRI